MAARPPKALWPWELFQAEDGSFSFEWSADHIATLLGAFFVVFFLIASMTPARSGRGAAVLTVAALGLVMLPPLTAPPEVANYATYLGYALLGLGAASVIGRRAVGGGGAGKGFLFVMIVLLLASLFFPAASSGPDYDAPALATWRALTGDGDFFETFFTGAHLVVLLQAVVLLVALLAWLGVDGGWTVWVAGLALYLGVLGPIGWKAVDHMGSTDEFACQGLHQALVLALPAAFLAFALPTAAGAIDATRD